MKSRVTLLHTVPSLAQSWLAEKPDGVHLASLRWTFFAGEVLSADLVRKWREAFPQAGGIVNLYGPTETTLVKCAYVVPELPGTGVVPVGTPLPGYSGTRPDTLRKPVWHRRGRGDRHPYAGPQHGIPASRRCAISLPPEPAHLGSGGHPVLDGRSGTVPGRREPAVHGTPRRPGQDSWCPRRAR